MDDLIEAVYAADELRFALKVALDYAKAVDSAAGTNTVEVLNDVILDAERAGRDLNAKADAAYVKGAM